MQCFKQYKLIQFRFSRKGIYNFNLTTLTFIEYIMREFHFQIQFKTD